MSTTVLLYPLGYDFKSLFQLSSHYNRERDGYCAASRSVDAAGE